MYIIKEGIVSFKIGVIKNICGKILYITLQKSIFYELSKDDFKEALSDDFRDVILFCFFTHSINNNTYMNQLSNLLKKEQIYIARKVKMNAKKIEKD